MLCFRLLELSRLINKKGIKFTQAGGALTPAGGALLVGIFGMKALEVYPDMKGTASALLTAIRQVLASGLVAISGQFFDGSIRPVATLIFLYGVISWVCYLVLEEPKNEPNLPAGYEPQG